MLQKIIWMRYLILGIFSTLLFGLNISCSQEEKDCLVISEFVYINSSSYSLETPIGKILPNSQLSEKYDYLGSCAVKANDYLPPFRDILIIKVNNDMCKTYKSISLIEGEGPLVISNYRYEKISDNNFKFTYIFTESEFKKLEICN